MKNKFIIVLLAILFILNTIAASYGYVNRDREKVNNKNDVKEALESIEVLDNNFKTVSIENLNEKFNLLDFSNTKSYKAGDEEESSVEIINDKIRVNINFEEYDSGNDLTVEYKIDYTISSIKKPISVKMGYSSQGVYVTYILNESGEVFRIMDFYDSMIENEKSYTGKVENMGIKNATSIAVTDKDFSLDNKEAENVAVYIKTKDDKKFTDEVLLEDQNGLVEIIDKQ